MNHSEKKNKHSCVIRPMELLPDISGILEGILKAYAAIRKKGKHS